MGNTVLLFGEASHSKGVPPMQGAVGMGGTEVRLSIITYKAIFTEPREYQQCGQGGLEFAIISLMCKHVNLFVTELNLACPLLVNGEKS